MKIKLDYKLLIYKLCDRDVIVFSIIYISIFCMRKRLSLVVLFIICKILMVILLKLDWRIDLI